MTSSLDDRLTRAQALHQQGRLDEAAILLQCLVAEAPHHAGAVQQFGMLHLQLGRGNEALTLLQQAQTLAPGSPDVQGNLGLVLQALDRPADAIAAFQAALALNPGLVEARYALANAFHAQGRFDSAVLTFRQLLTAEPNHAEAHFGLALALQAQGDAAAAATAYRAALALDPDFAEASYGLGSLELKCERFTEACACFGRALDVDPDYVEARRGLGAALSGLDRHEDAAIEYRRLLVAEPDDEDARCGLGGAMLRLKREQEAEHCYRRALATAPQHAGAHYGLACALRALGHLEDAVTACRTAITLRPDFVQAVTALGEGLMELGELDLARVEFERAIALAPDQPGAHLRLVNLGKVQPGAAELARLEKLLPRAESYPPQQEAQLQYALAKAYDDIGARERAFRHVLRGSEVERARIRYDEAATLAGFTRMQEVFNRDLIASRRGQGNPSATPVLIIGMPRSGSTLVEQILSSHPAIFGGGERRELSEIVHRHFRARLGSVPFPQAVWTTTQVELRQLGAEYAATLQMLAPAAARVTDKMLGNVLLAGLIHLMLPNARIIHTLRDPVDTCLSCFTRLFADGDLAFSYDLGELGRYYRGYRALMKHWRAVLPDGVLLDVRYEALVDDVETEAQRLVAHCGLPWDDRCLEFHKTRRAVRTASLVQVRQPIYRTSVGRWRPDAAQLRPLMEAIGDLS